MVAIPKRGSGDFGKFPKNVFFALSPIKVWSLTRREGARLQPEGPEKANILKGNLSNGTKARFCNTVEKKLTRHFLAHFLDRIDQEQQKMQPLKKKYFNLLVLTKQVNWCETFIISDLAGKALQRGKAFQKAWLSVTPTSAATSFYPSGS